MSSILLGMALGAVAWGVFVFLTLAAMPLAIVAILAYLAFLDETPVLLIAVATFYALFVALVSTCTLAMGLHQEGFGEWSLLIGILLGIAAGAFVGYRYVRRQWPVRQH